jgi:hypothetical protein
VVLEGKGFTTSHQWDVVANLAVVSDRLEIHVLQRLGRRLPSFLPSAAAALLRRPRRWRLLVRAAVITPVRQADQGLARNPRQRAAMA